MDADLHTSKTEMQLNMAATLVLLLTRNRHMCMLLSGSSRRDHLVCPAPMNSPALFHSLFPFSKHGLGALSFASYGMYKLSVTLLHWEAGES